MEKETRKLFYLFIAYIIINYAIIEPNSPDLLFAIFNSFFIVNAVTGLVLFSYYRKYTDTTKIKFKFKFRYCVYLVLLFYYSLHMIFVNMDYYPIFKAPPTNTFTDYLKFYITTIIHFYILIVGRKYISQLYRMALILFLTSLSVYLITNIFEIYDIKVIMQTPLFLNVSRIKYHIDLILIVYSFARYSEIRIAEKNQQGGQVGQAPKIVETSNKTICH